MKWMYAVIGHNTAMRKANTVWSAIKDHDMKNYEQINYVSKKC